MTIDLHTYRTHRALMISGEPGYCTIADVVGGHVIRHSELHRDMQRSLVELRRAYHG